jgi:hypothetical protein
MTSQYVPGWVDDKQAVDDIVATCVDADISSTPIGSTPIEELPASVYLWDLARKATGALLPPRNQGKVGSCVAFGTARAIEYTMCAEIVAGESEQYIPLATEPIYGGARVEVGGGSIRGDGAIGANAAAWVRDWGVLGREEYLGIDLREYSESRCREYGSKGVPLELEGIAKIHPVRAVTRVRTWVDAKKALSNGYGIALCSSQGFTMTRDANGIAMAAGTWQHCMCLCGYTTMTGREYGRIDNSWGASSHTGPVGPGSPGPEGFYASSSTIEAMLKSGDCWIFSNVEGFPQRKISWII